MMFIRKDIQIIHLYICIYLILSHMYIYLFIYAKLSGTLPSQLGQLSTLINLNLDNNLLEVPFPQILLDSIKISLGIIKFANSIVRPTAHTTNSFSGTLPSELGQLKSLQNFAADNNQLTGSLPTQFGSLFDLMYITLTGKYISYFSSY